ncbi:alpha/beta hydrolase [Microbacterium sp. CPCC 204701]|uniref:alpha/beta hydrolase n=1 Tax=Microbacterium sp. CPCC 204701 TaxID=2493084 RepID=UPI000FDA96DE|nr:alpha/beta hydrolase [Microbacterium sp. CPCC 204701]
MSLTSPELGVPLEHIDYDEGGVEALVDALRALADDGRDAGVVLRNIDGGLEGRGEAIRAVQTDAGDVAARITPTTSMFDRIAEALRSYGEAAAQHGRVANDLIEDIEAAHAAVVSAEETVVAAESRNDRLGEDATSREVTLAADAVADAEDDLALQRTALSALWERWEDAFRRWDEAYDSAVAALANVDHAYVPAGLRASVTALAGADSPAEVAAIWADLTDAEREELLRARPEFVGNLEGVPYAVRFAANRTVFDETVAAGPYGEPLDSQFEQLGIEMDRQDGELLMFHPFEQPQATAGVVYGVRRDAAGDIIDPFDGVSNVNVLVGGMFSGLGDLEAWGESARSLNEFAEAYGGEGTGSVTIAWYGYDSPDLLTEHTMGSATEGAARLGATLMGLDQEVSSSVTTSVIGHSYGSTTAFLAVGGSATDLGVDRLIAVGSAGVPDGYHSSWTGDEPMDYSGVDVYASRAPGDGIARYGEWSSFGHGTDPESIEGATSFESDGGTAPSLQGTQEPVAGTPGHASHDGGNTVWGWWEQDNGYLSRDSESFRNIAYIVANGEVLP